MRTLSFTVTDEFNGINVEKFLRYHCKLSARLLVKLKRIPNGLTANGNHIRTIDLLHTGDIMQINLPDDRKHQEAKDLPIKIAYEDEDVLVVNKPYDMPNHPSPGHDCDSLANAVAAHYQKSGEIVSFRPVYRLDKDTSGLVVIAKNSYVAARLAKSIDKEYSAVCEGEILGSGTINAPIRLKEGHGIEREVGDGGEYAVTHWLSMGAGNGLTYLKLHLETGRTHQIRVHFSSIGHPLAGDDMYGGKLDFISRQALHCSKVHFIHPVTNKSISVICDLPLDIAKLLEYCNMHKT